MTYRQRPDDGGHGSWLVPTTPSSPAPTYEGADALRANRHWQNQRNGITRPRPDPDAWDALHARLCEQQLARGIIEPPPRPWHHEPDAETVPHPELRAWDRWYDVAKWAHQHGLSDLLPPRTSANERDNEVGQA